MHLTRVGEERHSMISVFKACFPINIMEYFLFLFSVNNRINTIISNIILLTLPNNGYNETIKKLNDF